MSSKDDSSIINPTQNYMSISEPVTEPERQYYFMNLLRQWLENEKKIRKRDLTFGIFTFGCQMNFHDSEKITAILEQIGFVNTQTEEADIVLYNTCTVRENANERIYGRLGVLKGYKKRNPGMMIALCGCMMQEEHVIDTIKKSYNYVDIIFGTHNIYKFAELLYTRIMSGDRVIDIWKEAKEIVEDLPVERKFTFKSSVNIMYGCNNFCSYCIVPYVRGRERSRKPEDIINEIKAYVADGAKEVMLLGQNVNSYGKNLEKHITFAELLKEAERIEGLERIRFMTSHPKDLSDELIDVIAGSNKICHHIHLPLQSGSTRILKAMNRVYSKEGYLDLAERIKTKIPDVSLTTDIIVGFPGETDEDLEETIDVVRKVGFDSAFTFIYSKRSGTPAAKMPDPSTGQQITERFNRLLAAVKDVAAKRMQRFEGTVDKVLVEEVNSHDPNMVTGRLSNNTVVHFVGDKSLIGQIVDVRLSKCMGFYYIGELEV